MRMAQQMAQHEWRDWIELNIFGLTSLLCCWVFWCISWELRECIKVGVLGLCVFVCEREKGKERERDICCGPPKKLQVSAMATQKSLQKCHQFAVYGRERTKAKTKIEAQKGKQRNEQKHSADFVHFFQWAPSNWCSSPSCCHILVAAAAARPWFCIDLLSSFSLLFVLVLGIWFFKQV